MSTDRLAAAREALTWTDEQAADATIEVLSEDFEVTVLRSWFMPDPGQVDPGPSQWVSRRDHARGMLQVGRALLDLRAALSAARREALEEAADRVGRMRDGGLASDYAVAIHQLALAEKEAGK